MSILVISDLHLDAHFEPNRCKRLLELITASDQVIICGDFWEGHGMDFSEFLLTDWSELFSLLKSKNTVYVFGNHDRRDRSDDRIYQFCNTATEQYKTVIGPVHYIFEHGNRLSPKIDEVLGIRKANPLYFAISEWIQLAFVKLFGIRGFWLMYHGQNEKIKRASAKEFGSLGNYMYVCGHTDCAEIDLPRHFANSGLCKYGFIQYLTIKEDGSIKFHMEKY